MNTTSNPGWVVVEKITVKDRISFYRVVTVEFSDDTKDVYKIYVPNSIAIGSEYHLHVGIIPIWMTFKKFMDFPKLIKNGCTKEDFPLKLDFMVEEYISLYYKICDRTDDPWLNYQIKHGYGFKKESYTGRITKENNNG